MVSNPPDGVSMGDVVLLHPESGRSLRINLDARQVRSFVESRRPEEPCDLKSFLIETRRHGHPVYFEMSDGARIDSSSGQPALLRNGDITSAGNNLQSVDLEAFFAPHDADNVFQHLRSGPPGKDSSTFGGLAGRGAEAVGHVMVGIIAGMLG